MKNASKQLGGFARAAVLSPERRKEIAQSAAKKRWDNYMVEKKAGEYPASSEAAITPEGNTSG